MNVVDIDGPHTSLQVKGEARSRHYIPFEPISEVRDWLVQRCQGDYLVVDNVLMSYEQGIGQMPFFRGCKFIFDNSEDAMLFKLTWM